MENLIEKVKEKIKRFNKLNEKLSSPNIMSDMELYTKLLKERAQIEELKVSYEEYKKIEEELEEYKNHENSSDSELQELAKIEIPTLESQLEKKLDSMLFFLIPSDPADKNNAIVEIRAGTGGDEAALFAGVLFRMYVRYIDQKGWKMEVLDENPTDLGGYKIIVFKVKGKRAFGRLKFESGVHRVQRVPSTEAGGRIHTSSASVAVLPEITKEIEVVIKDEELRIDVYRASGAGGQHVNRTESAVRITHLPTGIVVTCQNQRSQHQNKAQALDVLKSKLYQKKYEEERGKLSQSRRNLIGTGDRSEKIRTYNYPQGRITDHRIGFSVFRFQEFIDGDIEEMLDALQKEDTLDKIKEL